jgi:hypothetical protein
MVRAMGLCAPNLISLAELRFKVGAVVLAARLLGVFLPYSPLAYWFENQIAILS